jgi:hypothetical protein
MVVNSPLRDTFTEITSGDSCHLCSPPDKLGWGAHEKLAQPSPPAMTGSAPSHYCSDLRLKPSDVVGDRDRPIWALSSSHESRTVRKVLKSGGRLQLQCNILE